jgi:hypothetical protein
MHRDPEAIYVHRNSTLPLVLSPSTPISKISSPMYLCGGTTRFAGAWFQAGAIVDLVRLS